MAAAAIPLAQILVPILIQESPVLIADIVALFRKHPALPPDIWAALVVAIHATNQDTLNTIATDQAAHP